jgi:DNA-binding response OmpR family regulator
MTVTVRQLIEEQAAGLVGRTDYTGGSNVIEVLVGSIRRKLGDRSSAIETVRGMGYRFVATA